MSRAKAVALYRAALREAITEGLWGSTKTHKATRKTNSLYRKVQAEADKIGKVLPDLVF